MTPLARLNLIGRFDRILLDTSNASSIKDMPKFHTPAFVLGNGIERRKYDCSELAGRGTVFACNYFFEEYPTQFSDAPIYLIIGDEPPIMRYYKYSCKYPVIIPERPAVAFAANKGLTDFLYAPYNLFGKPNSGLMAIKLALFFECYPIFILGIGDDFQEVSDGNWTDSMHPDVRNRVTVEGYRRYNKEAFYSREEQNKRWIEGFRNVYSANPGKIFRLGGGGYPFVPLVKWDNALENLPVKYGTKPTCVDDVETTIPCLLDS